MLILKAIPMNNPLRDTLRGGGAAVVRLDLEGWHDVLLTGIEGDEVHLFDPYYCAKPFGDPTLQMVMDHPDAYNRIVPVSYLERETRTLYALGPLDGRRGGAAEKPAHGADGGAHRRVCHLTAMRSQPLSCHLIFPRRSR